MKASVIGLLVSLVLVLLAGAQAGASDNSWLINIKAVNPVFGGGASLRVGVGTSGNSTQIMPQWTGNTASAEGTANYGDTTQWHERHDVPRTTEGGERYCWDLKMGAGLEYETDTMYICLWNNGIAFAGIGGELNNSLAYVLAKRVAGSEQVLAWFSDASLQTAFQEKKPGTTADVWHDTSVLIKNAVVWAPMDYSGQSLGFYVTDTVTKGDTYESLGDYRFYAFDQYSAQNWTDPLPVPPEGAPEPGSLLALGSGLLGAAGLALRRRRE